uniref:Uncharacterized protein n=1 Tax=Myotis myotis TaxID=51298 RepID=A0A7J7UP87_MYOMY|nr:hypothetical protein mMyoMyo1_008540 [Myotis myotis]
MATARTGWPCRKARGGSRSILLGRRGPPHPGVPGAERALGAGRQVGEETLPVPGEELRPRRVPGDWGVSPGGLGHRFPAGERELRGGSRGDPQAGQERGGEWAQLTSHRACLAPRASGETGLGEAVCLPGLRPEGLLEAEAQDGRAGLRSPAESAGLRALPTHRVGSEEWAVF